MQLKKFIPININQQIITLIIHKTPDSDIFWYFLLKIRVFDEVYAYLTLQSAAVFSV